jgi:hypothetical protein
MRRNTLLIDVGIALVLAILVVVISPGLAVVGMLALVVLLVCAISFGIDRRRKRRRTNPVNDLRRSRPPNPGAPRPRSGAVAPARRSPSRGRAPRGRASRDS